MSLNITRQGGSRRIICIRIWSRLLVRSPFLNFRMRFFNFGIVAVASATSREDCLTDLAVGDDRTWIPLIVSADGKSAFSRDGTILYTVDYKGTSNEHMFDALFTFHETAGDYHKEIFGSKKTVNKCTDSLLVVELPKISPFENFAAARNAACPNLSAEAEAEDFHKLNLEESETIEDFFQNRRFYEAIKTEPRLADIFGEIVFPPDVSKVCRAQMAVVRYSKANPLENLRLPNDQEGKHRFYRIARAFIGALKTLHEHHLVLGEKVNIEYPYYTEEAGV